jgi:uncharacterized LabA/DUF88 family protein
VFKAKTERVAKIADEQKGLIDKIDLILSGKTLVYIDYANVRPWSNKLRFHVDLKRLKHFLDSFSQIDRVHLYQGTLVGDISSEATMRDIESRGYVVHTKPVKMIDLSIDVSSLKSMQSPDLLRDLVCAPFLKTLALSQVENLNQHLQNLNGQGVKKLQDKKCNFDVEVGVDMLLAFERNEADTFALWSGDSDFREPILRLLSAQKKVVLFATAGRIARELNDLKLSGLVIFDIRDIRNFICWPKELCESPAQTHKGPLTGPLSLK